MMAKTLPELTNEAADLSRKIEFVRRLGLPFDEITIQITKDAGKYIRPLNDIKVKKKVEKLIEDVINLSAKMKNSYDFSRLSETDSKICADWLRGLKNQASGLAENLPTILANIEKINSSDWRANQREKILTGHAEHHNSDLILQKTRDSAQAADKTLVDSQPRKKQVHFIWSAKGGIGKTWIAYLLAQYFQEIDGYIKCFDIDPICKSLSAYESLNVKLINVLQDSSTRNGQPDIRQYDAIFNEVLACDGIYIVDGPLMTLDGYLKDCGVLNLLRDSGYQVYFHGVIVGGSGLLSTAMFCRYLAQRKKVGEIENLVVWQNEYFGPIRKGEKEFKDMKCYADIGVDSLKSPVLRKPTEIEQNALNELVFHGLTFRDAMFDPNFGHKSKRGINQYKFEVLGQLAALGF